MYVSRHNQEQLPVNFTPVTEKEFITREVLNSNKLFTTQKFVQLEILILEIGYEFFKIST